MNSLKNIIRKHQKEIPYFIMFFCIMIIIHLCIREYSGDTPAYFSKLLNKYTFKGAMSMRYRTWTSRIIIETPLLLISHNLHLFIWAVVDFLMVVLLLFSLMKLTHYKHNKIVIVLILLYPFIDMRSAGWVATTVNYLWPLALGCASFVLLDKLYHNEKLNLMSILFFMICELFSTNFETFSVFYFIVLTFVNVLMFLEHKHTIKSHVLISIQYVISIGNIFLALSCPGNWHRNAIETTRWMRDYPTLTMADKLMLGIEDTMSKLIQSNILFLIFTLVLFLIVLKKKTTVIKTVVASVPFFSVLFITLLSPFSEAYFKFYKLLFAGPVNVTSMNYNSLFPYAAFIFFVVIVVIIVLLLLNYGKDIKSSMFIVCIFLAGFATRVVMGFSPTLYASSIRTFIFLDFAIIYCIVRLVDDNELYVYDKKYEKYINIFTVLFIIFYSLNTILCITSI